jgi:hypothetical protein
MKKATIIMNELNQYIDSLQSMNKKSKRATIGIDCAKNHEMGNY